MKTKTMNAKAALFIQIFNVHGLIRGNNLELGKNSDTGGQTNYVLELAKTLSKSDRIRKVEIITRLIDDKIVSKDYAVPVEQINDKLKIVRIKCGGKKYIRKELLWEHIDEFVDNTIKYIKSSGDLPDIIHSHYADAGYVCTQLTRFFGIPLIHTGHSLGRVKKENLLNNNLSDEEIEKKYKITRRIQAEEDVIFFADKIITSTLQEITSQYIYYENYSLDKFTVLPPGVDLEKFFPYNQKREWDASEQQIRDNIRNELWKFFTNMHKPILLTLCRPEKRKNISGLITAFGRSKELQQKANLAIYAGIRKDIQEMPELEREVLTEMLLLLDKYNLYGKMAIPKKHDFERDVPELYRLAAESRGVFINATFKENFGLTLIEAASCGLPIVSSNDGGPQDIVKNLNNGILTDVQDTDNISNAILKIINNNSLWDKYSNNGIHEVEKFYTWEAHTNKYLNLIEEVINKKELEPAAFISTGKKFLDFEKMMIFDIDNTITGDVNAMNRLNEIVLGMNKNIGFGVATGRTIESACEVLARHNFVKPDVIISSVGSEIYYKSYEEYIYSTSWDAHIKNAWKPEKIKELLREIDFIELQDEANQRKYKVSYNLLNSDGELYLLSEILTKNKIKTNLILSHNKYIDFLPYRASKGRAIRYLSYKWNIPYHKILVGGDSGNDEDMLIGELLGAVVANYTSDLEKLRGRRRIYFAKGSHANGLIEAIEHYNFLKGDYSEFN